MATTISVNKQTIEQFLLNARRKPFVIPEYQRPYSWTNEQIDTLFRDIWEFTSNDGGTENDGTYFLGSIVSYENEDGEQEIIDGQQRITSLFLLLRAIYTKLTVTDEKSPEAINFISKIEPLIWRTNKLTGKVDYASILLTSKVISDSENEILKNILETGNVKEKAQDSYSKNYKQLLELLEEKSKENALMIYQFIYALLNQVIILPITADTQDTALTIFSTLNDRGLPLSDADIFKAKIYNNLNKEEKEKFIEEWKELEEDSLRISESIQQLFYYHMFYQRALENDKVTTTPGLRKYYSANKFERILKPNILSNLRQILNLWEVISNKNVIEDEEWSKNIEILKILDILTSYPNEFWKYPVIIYYLRYKDNKDFEERYLGHEKSEELHKFLVENEYVDEEGNAKDKLKADLRDNRLVLPQEFEHIRPAIEKKLKSSAGKLIIKNADDKKKIKVNKEVFLDKNFSELWDKIKYKTTCKVNFDSNNLIAKCVKDIDDYLFIEDEKYIFEKKRLALTHGGIEEGFSTSEDSRIDFQVKYKLPDIITYLQNETNLTRKSIVEILTRTETLDSFKKNPQLYLEKVTDIIKKTMKNFIVDGIKYEKIGNGEFYSQDLFEAQELFGYLKDKMNKEGNMLASTKSSYENIVLDSDIERNFALELEKNKNVVIYTKLPAWFKIPTPLGNYNPDWAVLVRPDLTSPEQKLYFVVETKGSVFADDRRETENLKITCGKKHFKAISEDINFQVANDFEYFSSKF